MESNELDRLAQQVVDSICEFANLDEVKNHLTLLLKSTRKAPISHSQSLFGSSLQ